MKTCKRCGEHKPFTEYQKHPAARDGHKYNCNTCRATLKRERYASDGGYKAKQIAIAEKWRDANREQHRASARDWYAANQERGKAKATAWAASNPDKKRAIGARRYAAERSALPVWANADAIAVVYAQAAMRGMEVDHVVPLRSPIVCGLHCEANLQVLVRQVNTSKGNRWWPDMP